jgi:hypothetical protein
VGGVLAGNIRAFRSLRWLSQDGLAGRMRFLGHEWSRTTVSEVERQARKVSADELIALALVLNATLAELGNTHGQPLRLGQMEELSPEQVAGLLAGQRRVGLDWLGAGVHRVVAT